MSKNLYAINPFTGEVVTVGVNMCALDGDEYNGDAVFSFSPTPFDSSDVEGLHALETQQTTLWATGWDEDGSGAPPKSFRTEDGEFDFDFPDRNTWFVFEGYLTGVNKKRGSVAMRVFEATVHFCSEPIMIVESKP